MDGSNPPITETALSPLALRERRFFLLFLQELPQKEIAYQMGITRGAVSSMKARVMKKLEIRSDFRLFLFGIRARLVSELALDSRDDLSQKAE